MDVKLKHGEIAVIDADDLPLISGYRWRLNAEGYAVSHRCTGSGREGTKTHTVFMHRLINGTSEGTITDHIDRNPLNNRRENLRTADKSLNSFNSKLHSTNKSGYRGVSRQGNRWRATIVVNGKQEHLGRFDDPRDASLAYQKRLALVLGHEPCHAQLSA